MKDKVLKIILIISSLPFIGLLLIGIYSMFFGFTFFFSTSYGIEAFLGSIFIIGWLLCIIPVLPICLIYQIFYLIRHLVKKNKQKNIEYEVIDEEPENLI